MAIAAGTWDGPRLGHNARAALITRGLAEISPLGVRLGGRIETFMGTAGAGDLILTGTGDLSRNRTVGLHLAAGEALPATPRSLGHVAEGVSTAYELARLAQARDVKMPITHAVCGVLAGMLAAAGALAAVLERDPRTEFSSPKQEIGPPRRVHCERDAWRPLRSHRQHRRRARRSRARPHEVRLRATPHARRVPSPHPKPMLA